ncbi:MAG: hypothetical protein IT370_28470 [Deltaproteobacteria bacterium]|nr:hypothetical protein [Deltaproteobacteria bacterium]
MTMASGALLTLAAAGCGGTESASPEDTQRNVAALLPGLYADGVDTFAALDGPATAGARQALDSVDRSFPDYRLGERVGAGATHLEGGDTARADGEQLARALNQRLFIAANLESPGYRLRPATLCDAPDDDCAAFLTQHPLWIRSELTAAGIELGLVIGKGHDEPLTLELGLSGATLRLDLGEAAAVIRDFGVEQVPAMSGQLSLTLTRHALRDAELTLAGDRASAVDRTRQGLHYRLSAAPSHLVAVRANLDARTVVARLDLQRLQVLLPDATGPDLAISIGALTGQLELAAATTSVQLKELSGSALIEADGKSVFEFGVSKFDLAISSDGSAASAPLLAITPSFELRVKVDLSPFGTAQEPTPADLIEQSYMLTVSPREVQPASAAPVLKLVAPSATSAGGIKVVTGELGIWASGGGLRVSEGQCLVSDPVTAGENHVVGAFAARACE